MNHLSSIFYYLSFTLGVHIILDIHIYFWGRYYHHCWPSLIKKLQLMLTLRLRVTLELMVSLMSGQLWCSSWLAIGIGMKIFLVDPFWCLVCLSLLTPLVGYEYTLPQHPPSHTTLTWQLATTLCLDRGTIFGHCRLFNSKTRFCHHCCARGGCYRSPQILYISFNFAKKKEKWSKNWIKGGTRGRWGELWACLQIWCSCDAIFGVRDCFAFLFQFLN